MLRLQTVRLMPLAGMVMLGMWGGASAFAQSSGPAPNNLPNPYQEVERSEEHTS